MSLARRIGLVDQRGILDTRRFLGLYRTARNQGLPICGALRLARRHRRLIHRRPRPVNLDGIAFALVTILVVLVAFLAAPLIVRMLS